MLRDVMTCRLAESSGRFESHNSFSSVEQSKAKLLLMLDSKDEGIVTRRNVGNTYPTTRHASGHLVLQLY